MDVFWGNVYLCKHGFLVEVQMFAENTISSVVLKCKFLNHLLQSPGRMLKKVP